MAKKVSKAEFKHSMRKRMVDVSQTKFDSKSKRVTDAKGNLLTGSVDMGGGKTQTYEKGRRVTVSKKMKGFRDAPKKTATKSGSGSGDKKQSKVYEVQKYKQSNAPSAKTGSSPSTSRSADRLATDNRAASSNAENKRAANPVGVQRAKDRIKGRQSALQATKREKAREAALKRAKDRARRRSSPYYESEANRFLRSQASRVQDFFTPKFPKK